MATKSFIKTIGQKGLLADYNTEGKKLQTELIAGDNITIDGNTISSDQVFVAKYGITTYAEIKAAYDAGKICTVFKDDRYYYLTLIDYRHILLTSLNEKDTVDQVSVGTGNTWLEYSGKLQSKLTFDTEPKAGSKNPVTSDGIKKAIDAKQNSLKAGNNITIDGDTISSNQVFVATYGTTKYAEIKEAYNAGKICTVFKDDRYYYLTLIDYRHILFTSFNEKDTVDQVSVGSGNTWLEYSGKLQSKPSFKSIFSTGMYTVGK